MDGNDWLPFAIDFPNMASLWYYVKLTHHISKWLEWVINIDRPVEAGLHFSIFSHGNIGDEIGNLQMHILNLLNEQFHFRVVAFVEGDFL